MFEDFNAFVNLPKPFFYMSIVIEFFVKIQPICFWTLVWVTGVLLKYMGGWSSFVHFPQSSRSDACDRTRTRQYTRH